MKKIIFLCFLVMAMNALQAQTEAISPTYSFNITKKVIPPMLSLDANDISFEDEDGNGIINANEKCILRFTLRNDGQGEGLNLQAKLTGTGSMQSVKFAPSTPVTKVPTKQEVKGSIEIQSAMNTVDGKVVLELEIEEPNGFNADKVQIELQTAAFVAPNIKVVDYTLASADGSSTLELGKPFILQLLVQNTGQGEGSDVKIQLPLPENTFFMNGEEFTNIERLAPGEVKSLEYELAMNKKYVGSELSLEAKITESYNKYAQPWEGKFALQQNLAAQRMVVEGKKDSPKSIQEASLRSDVDKDIPEGIAFGPKRYALIIGNEDYTKYQTGLDQEVNVAFARNDAEIMAQYVERTLGFSKQNVVVLKDATKGQMSQEIAKLLRYAELGKGESEILFYYSGHGLPEETTKEPYLIPVDVSGAQVSNGYALNQLYSQLAQHPTKKCTVILDACFSGGARNKELVAMKGVKVKASVSNVPSNLVVMTSSSGQESSAVFKEKQHGLFTYYLLKSLKESKGTQSYQATMNEVTEQVALEATRMNKIQTPQLLMGGLVQSKIGTLGWGN
jgi:hypothetical protein